MTSYAQLHVRNRSVAQLGSMVNAMRGIAAARAQQGRQQLANVQIYADMVAESIAQVLAILPDMPVANPSQRAELALLVLCAEHGFAGAFSEQVLAKIEAQETKSRLLVVGTRGVRMAQAKGLTPVWSASMISQQAAVAGLADSIAAELYSILHTTDVGRIDIIYAKPNLQQGFEIVRYPLLPLDFTRFKLSNLSNPPLLNLTPKLLLEQLASEYLFAQLNEAIMHSYAAENTARLQTMNAARDNIARRLDTLTREERLARQEEITAEIIELAAGKRALRSK